MLGHTREQCTHFTAWPWRFELTKILNISNFLPDFLQTQSPDVFTYIWRQFMKSLRADTTWFVLMWATDSCKCQPSLNQHSSLINSTNCLVYILSNLESYTLEFVMTKSKLWHVNIENRAHQSVIGLNLDLYPLVSRKWYYRGVETLGSTCIQLWA